jgi:hypothetical protein
VILTRLVGEGGIRPHRSSSARFAGESQDRSTLPSAVVQLVNSDPSAEASSFESSTLLDILFSYAPSSLGKIRPSHSSSLHL